MITHYDLFAGIGGFSLALEEVFNDATIKHIFCEWEKFPTAVLRQHWPDGEFWGDIADLVKYTNNKGLEGSEWKGLQRNRQRRANRHNDFTIVTGGFPCQPFSAAGRRKGTADDRYQWPNMFEVIRNTSPEWVIAENVRGLVSWSDGLVLETVCADLESEGYEVQPFIIPAVAVGAPHRRDRVWIIGHNSNASSERRKLGGHNRNERQILSDEDRLATQDNATRSGRLSGLAEIGKNDTSTVGRQDAADPRRIRWQSGSSEALRPTRQESEWPNRQYPDWQRNWQEVAFATCDDSMDDGLSRLVDGVPISRAKWRKDSLKAYGNGIVPEVAMNIMQAIKESI